jgi:hypothetical protein
MVPAHEARQTGGGGGDRSTTTAVAPLRPCFGLARDLAAAAAAIGCG